MTAEFKEKSVKVALSVCAALSVAAVLIILIFLLSGGSRAFAEVGIKNFLLGKEWKPSENKFGIFPMFCGSIAVTFGAVIIAVPPAILCAVYLSEFCPVRLYGHLHSAVELLAGIPSVVYGFFGLGVIVPFFGAKGLLTSATVLAIMILPTVTSLSESALRAVPDSYKEGSLALGATAERSVFLCVLPSAKSGIAAGVVLGIGRAMGEALAVTMIAGNQAVLPSGIFGGVRTLTSNIVLEMGYASGLHRSALIATGAVLFVLILIINTFFLLIKRAER